MNEESDYELFQKRLAGICGVVLLLISAYFSYDGFDQKVSGGNSSYSTLAVVIGIVMCLAMSMFQFILSSRYEQLNPTLKLVGFASYAYSIYTTYLGAVHIMGMSNEMALAIALMFDIAPEPAIAWSFGDSLKGDLVGNLGKTALGMIGIGGKKKGQNNASQQRGTTDAPPSKAHENGKKNRHERIAELKGMYHGPDRRGGEREREQSHSHKAGNGNRNGFE